MVASWHRGCSWSIRECVTDLDVCASVPPPLYLTHSHGGGGTVVSPGRSEMAETRPRNVRVPAELRDRVRDICDDAEG